MDLQEDKAEEDDVSELAQATRVIVANITLILTLILTGCIAACQHVLVTMSLSWIVSMLTSWLVGSPGWRLKLLLHIGLVTRYPALHQFLKSIRNLIAKKGADAVQYFNMSWFGAQVLCYAITIGVLYNVSRISSFVWSWVPSAGVFSTVILVSVATVGYMFRSEPTDLIWHLFDGVLMLAELAAKLLPYISRGHLLLLRVSGRVFRLLYAYSQMTAEGVYKLQSRLIPEKKPEYWGEPYVFERLDADKEIRLLRISRKGPFAAVKCELITAPLAKLPPYEAISYTWGDQPRDQTLMIDGRTLPVSQVVIDVIDERARFLDTKLLWIDGICINQHDLAEKAAQIGCMQEIYKTASQVTVWLGTAPDASQCVHYLVDLHWRLQFKMDDRAWRSILGIGSQGRAYRAFFNFLSHPYWRRAWIIQEIALSDAVIISYGGQYFDWSFFETVITALVDRRRQNDALIVSDTSALFQAFPDLDSFYHISMLRDARFLYRSDTVDFVLADLAVLSNAFKTTDPRDKFYSLLGLLKSPYPASLIPDYTKSMRDLSVDFAKDAIETRPIIILLFAGIGFPRSTPSLPSWVPDYTATYKMAPISRTDEYPATLCHKASGTGLELFRQTHHTFDILTIRYIPFDTIKELGPVFFIPDLKVDATKEMERLTQSSLAYHDFAMTRLPPGPYLHTEQSREEAIWRARIGNRVIKSEPLTRPAPDHWADYYTNHLRYMRWRTRLHDEDTLGKDSEEPSYIAEVSDSLSDLNKHESQWAKESVACCQGRRVAVTHSGALAMVPTNSMVGDTVGVIQGHEACVAMRRESKTFFTTTHPSTTDDDGLLSKQPANTQRGKASSPNETTMEAQWRYVGECYIHGFMDGEALNLGSFQVVNVW